MMNLLQYVEAHQLLLCKKHSYGIAADAVKNHLSKRHQIKEVQLRAVLEYVDSLPSLWSTSQHQHLSCSNQAPISGLTVYCAYQCALSACNEERMTLSIHCQTVEKHQDCVHQVEWTKLTKSDSDMIHTVSVQSFFLINHFQSFLVQAEHESSPSLSSSLERSVCSHLSISHTLQADMLQKQQQVSTLQKQILIENAHSQQQWQDSFKIFSSSADNDTAQCQTLSWLLTTEISNFLKGLTIPKKVLCCLVNSSSTGLSAHSLQLIMTTKALHAVLSSSTTLIQQCVFHTLSQYCVIATSAKVLQSIICTTAWYLNSFEPDCTSVKVFRGVQKHDFMQWYSKKWAALLIFLITVDQDLDEDSVIAHSIFKLKTQILAASEVVSVLHHIIETADRLHAVNIDELSFAAYLDSSQSTLISSSCQNDCNSSFIILHAKNLTTAVSDLFITLVQTNNDSAYFIFSVMIFAAIHTLTYQGMWVTAQHYSSFLSCMIHCMQLWLLSYCISDADWDCYSCCILTTVVKNECWEFLINISSSSITELSFWRLLFWTASNDTVHVPEITVDTYLMWVQHSHIDLELDAWCVSLKSCLHAVTDILKNELLLATYAVSHYLINTLKNNTGNKVSEGSFLTDSHNQLNAVNDWLFHCLHTDSHLLTQYFHFSTPGASSNIASQESAINSYLHANQHFLHVLTCLVYMSFSLPLHCKKLVTIL